MNRTLVNLCLALSLGGCIGQSNVPAPVSKEEIVEMENIAQKVELPKRTVHEKYATLRNYVLELEEAESVNYKVRDRYFLDKGCVKGPKGRLIEVWIKTTEGDFYFSLGEKLVTDNLSIDNILHDYNNGPKDLNSYKWKSGCFYGRVFPLTFEKELIFKDYNSDSELDKASWRLNNQNPQIPEELGNYNSSDGGFAKEFFPNISIERMKEVAYKHLEKVLDLCLAVYEK